MSTQPARPTSHDNGCSVGSSPDLFHRPHGRLQLLSVHLVLLPHSIPPQLKHRDLVRESVARLLGCGQFANVKTNATSSLPSSAVCYLEEGFQLFAPVGDIQAAAASEVHQSSPARRYKFQVPQGCGHLHVACWRRWL